MCLTPSQACGNHRQATSLVAAVASVASAQAPVTRSYAPRLSRLSRLSQPLLQARTLFGASDGFPLLARLRLGIPPDLTGRVAFAE